MTKRGAVMPRPIPNAIVARKLGKLDTKFEENAKTQMRSKSTLNRAEQGGLLVRKSELGRRNDEVVWSERRRRSSYKSSRSSPSPP